MKLMALQAADVDTICNALAAMFIVFTATARSIEQAAGDRGIIDYPRILVFKFMHAASPAAIT